MWINNSFVQVRRQSVLDIRIASGVSNNENNEPRKAQPGITNEEDFRDEIVMQRHNYMVARVFRWCGTRTAIGIVKNARKTIRETSWQVMPAWDLFTCSLMNAKVLQAFRRWNCIIIVVFCSASVMQERRWIPAISIKSSRCRRCRISNLIHECRRGTVNGCFSYVTGCRCSYTPQLVEFLYFFLAMVLAICHFYRKAVRSFFSRCKSFCTHNCVRTEIS